MTIPLPLLVRERCHYCSKFRSPNEIIHRSGGVAMCWNCYEWHLKALQMLAGHPPPGCQECGVTFDQLAESSPDGNIPMTMVPKDGIYAVLCRPCADRYVPKRVDLYGDTKFGWDQKLKGSK